MSAFGHPNQRNVQRLEPDHPLMPRIATSAVTAPGARPAVRVAPADSRLRERLLEHLPAPAETLPATPRSAKLLELLRILETLRQVPVELDPQKVQ